MMSVLARISKLKKEKFMLESRGQHKRAAEICKDIGDEYNEQNDFDTAKEYYSEACQLYKAINDQQKVGFCNRLIGECFSSLGNYKSALSYQNVYLQIAKQSSDDVEQQRAYATIGKIYLDQEHTCTSRLNRQEVLMQAQQAFQRSTVICTRLDDIGFDKKELSDMKLRLKLNLGLVFEKKHEYEKSISYLKQANDIARKYSLNDYVFRCQMALCDVYQLIDKFTEALECLDVAFICVKDKLGDKLSLAQTLYSKGIIHMQCVNLDSARHSLKKAHRVKHLDTYQQEKSQSALKSVIRILLMNNEVRNVPTTEHQRLKDLYQKMGELASVHASKLALHYYQMMLKQVKQLSCTAEQLATIYGILAATYSDDRQYELSVKYYREQLQQWEIVNNYKECANTYLSIAEVNENANKDLDTLESLYNCAYKSACEARIPSLQVQILKQQSVMELKYSEPDKSTATLKRLQALQEQYDLDLDSQEVSEDDRQSSEQTDSEDDICLSDLSNTDDEEEFVCKRIKRYKIKCNTSGESELQAASIKGDLRLVKKLIAMNHPINVRDHSGWTPLHDAASNGHVEVMEILLEHGANINDRGEIGSKQSEGVTPLHEAAMEGQVEAMTTLLQHGADANILNAKGKTPLRVFNDMVLSREISAKEQLQVTQMRKYLKNCMRGHNTMLPDLAHHTSNDSSDNELPDIQPTRKNNTNKQRRNKPRSVSPVSLMSESYAKHVHSPETTKLKNLKRGRSSADSSIRSHSTHDSDTYTQSILNTEQLPTGAKAYKQVMESIGASSLRTLTQSNRITPAAQSYSTVKYSNDDIDDWLEDDVQPAKKKRRDHCTFLSTGGTRGPNKPKKDSPLKVNPAHSQPLQPLSPCIIDPDEMEDFSDIFFGDEDETLDAITNMNITEQPTKVPSRNKAVQLPNKKKQTTLTQFTGSQTGNVEIVRERHLNTVQEETHERLLYMPEGQIEQLYRHANTQDNRIKLQVSIRDCKYDVVVRNEHHTMDWLIQEVARRYATQHYQRPTMTLLTSDGTLLQATDLIVSVLNDGDCLQAMVDRMEDITLVERYQNAAKLANVVPYDNISKQLENSTTSGILNLSNIITHPSQFTTLCQILKGQHQLCHLDLTGGSIGNDGFKCFILALDSFTSLRILKVACCRLTCVSLQCLAEKLMQYTNMKPLQVLETLDFSYNNLDDSCTLSLVQILNNLPSLCSLLLASCNFTHKLFEQHKIALKEAMRVHCLQSFDWSYNSLTSQGVEIALRSMNTAAVTFLNLTGTVGSYTVNLIAKHLATYLTHKSCVMHTLILDSCQLTSEHVCDLSRLLANCPTLQRLSLENNPELSASDISQLTPEGFEGPDNRH